ncbi:hypothetical protein FEM48_Zijuj06G0045700 [Ziziphus jujuba var. spinosa]|uniref:KIB1-4 beta-propeller domain-containing protein n=1 Tax=Ziziphus jujuba var. spinosa TaxID=714518 RepID=A0A978V770_ZIZJJ|nr:hypothetical protein FEM48_Zijuj06G0045700 [Ziziphus jujuba var. spinosa]
MFPKGWSTKDFESPAFFSLVENKFYHITNGHPYNYYRYEVVGLSYGWLVIFTVPGYPYIINPFTSSCIIQLLKLIKSKDKKKRQLLSISKAIIPSDFYSSSFWVTVIYGPHRKCLEFLKHSHKTWTHLGGASEVYIDIIFYNGMLYALRNGRVIEVWDFLSPSPKKVMDLEVSPALPQLVTYTKAFLVESMGKLLFVLRLTGGESPNLIDQFFVYQLDCGGERWITMETLSNRAFFVSKHQCVSVYAQDLLQVEENSIYFLTTDYTTFGICNLKERRMINNTCAINNREKPTRASFWFVLNRHWMANNVGQLPIR